MHRRTATRRSHAFIALSTAACLSLAGCSLPLIAPHSRPAPSTASSPSPTSVGTVTPPVHLKGLDKLGLRKATMTVTAEPDTVNYDRHGLTYAEPRTDPAADLIIHHVTWDGTETWSGSIPVPASEDGTTFTPIMSYDDALGVVSYWFTTDQPGPADDRFYRNLHVVASPVYWFTTSSGERGIETFSSDEDFTYIADHQLIGVLLKRRSENSVTHVRTMDITHHFVTQPCGDLGILGNHQALTRSWGGNVIMRTLDEPTGIDALYVNGTTVISDLASDSNQWFTFNRILVLELPTSRLWSVTADDTHELDNKSCAFPQANFAAGTANAYDFLGQLRISGDGSTECLSELIGNDTDTITTILSDGSILTRSPRSEDGEYSYRLISADGSTITTLPKEAGFRADDGYLVFTDEDGAEKTVVTAFSENDLKPSGS